MDTRTLDSFVVVSAVICIGSWLVCRKRRGNRFPLPPGPKGLPVIGNALDILGQTQWDIASKLGQEYGDLAYIEICGQHHLFLNSYEAVIELFERRSSNYSSRYVTTMLKLEGWDEWFIPAMTYGDRLRKSRQYLNKFLHKSATTDYHKIQTQSTHKLLMRLVQNPDAYHEHVNQWAAETIIKIAYGFEVVEKDPLVELIHKGIQASEEATTFSVANALPILRHLPSWFPGARFHKEVQEGRCLAETMRSEPFNEAKKRMANGKASTSMLSKLLESNAESNGSSIDEKRIAESVAVAYAGGGDTTVAGLMTFILAMVLYPDVMKKGQEELDRVIGRGSLPTIEDRPKLPYIEAICFECLRWQTVLPIGIPHLSEKDDVYNGYFIPSGTILYGSAWAILRDPTRYSEPDKLIPERWLPWSRKGNAFRGREGRVWIWTEVNPCFLPNFGSLDRLCTRICRICPGRFLAENSIFISVASILAVFDIQKALDEHGIPITPEEAFQPSFIRQAVAMGGIFVHPADTMLYRHPEPFKCNITPRTEDAVALIHEVASMDVSMEE